MPYDELSKDLKYLEAKIEAKEAELTKEIENVREMLKNNEISTESAHRKINDIEKEMRDMHRELKSMTKQFQSLSNEVGEFSPKLDGFMDKLWRAFFLLIFIVGALVGVKLW